MIIAAYAVLGWLALFGALCESAPTLDYMREGVTSLIEVLPDEQADDPAKG